MVAVRIALAVAAGAEDGVVLLFVQPLQEFLEPFVGLDFFHGIERVAEFVVGPGLVDEIFTGTAGGRGFASAFAARNDVMPPGGDGAAAEDTDFFHRRKIDRRVCSVMQQNVREK